MFDPLRLRRNLWEGTDTGGGQILCKSCLYAKVLWIQPKGTTIEPPWEEWSQIVQWFGPAIQGEKWRIFWFPAHIQRILPEKGHEVGPENINGGYCYPCNPHIIVVYRYEEASRVLIHELLHAACTDPPDASLPIKEATTETWAELLLVALCSKGQARLAERLWKLQSQWIANQNYTLETYHHVKTIENYAWRYTVGRKEILDSLRISLPVGKLQRHMSSRLTHPALSM